MPATFDLTELLQIDDIHLNFEAASVVEAIGRLLRPALTQRIHDSQLIEEIIAAAIKREEESTTRCGPLALPHARSAKINEFILSLGVNGGAGVISGHSDPRLIFAFVSPEGKREQHLQLLAALAKLSQNPAILNRITGASTTDQVVDALRAVITPT